jgi:hypothetical protein
MSLVLLIYLPVHLVIIPELILITQCINSLIQGVLNLILLSILLIFPPVLSVRFLA